ncbi:MAG: ABC transporter ATP-binding protein [Selenomonadaceae bacterium]|nr:ABC transporter ATP-binding protein [Selenomonadaceae bacterium]MBQ7493963.1 ABC transporter ATP-binding protein [Selenomonadaceae bacterium]
MLLDVKNLAVSYGKNPTPTIEGVSFDLNDGEILAIVGESGSGKTTVIRAILNVLPGGGHVSNGSMTFDGKNLLELDAGGWRALRGKNISMIFQDSGNMMNPVHTIGKQFVEYIQVHSDLDKRAAWDMAIEKLELMNLPNPENILNSYTFELSGGMRQRVGIAMAITFQPKLLLADEPTSALDVTTQAQIVGELMFITRGSGAAMIIVTHNIGVASYLADNLMVMSGGRVVEYGKTDDVINRPQAEYTKTLLASVPEIGGRRYV